MTEIKDIPLDKIKPDPNQPRKYFDEKGIQELAESINKQGLLENPLVRPVSDDEFMIVHGERRYKACEHLEWAEIPCKVKNLSKGEARDIQLIENLQRDNLSDMELAWDFQRRSQDGQTQKEIAERIGKSRSFVAKRLSLLKLPDKDQNRLLKGEISYSAARELVTVDGEERTLVSENSTAREIQEIKKGNVPCGTSESENDGNASFNRDSGKGKTKVSVPYGTLDSVDRTDLEVWDLIRKSNSVPLDSLESAYEKDQEMFERLKDD